MIPVKARFVMMSVLLTLGGYFIYAGVSDLTGTIGGWSKIIIGIFAIALIAYYGLFK